MLQARGWTPGASLGARDKPYTRAQGISHIKVSLKDDNLGLGAKAGPNVPQPGLDAFQGLLGRLNGKSDTELVKEQSTRDDIRRKTYAERRWGGLNFVSAGLLVGDRIEASMETQQSKSVRADLAKKAAPMIAQSEGTRLHDILSSSEEHATGTETKIVKKSKKRRKHTDPEKDGSKTQVTADNAVKDDMGNPEAGEGVAANNEDTGPEVAAKACRRAEKAQRKLERRARKEAKQTSRAQKGKEFQTTTVDVKTKDLSTAEDAVRPVKKHPMHERYERNAVRRRYIMQKKMALADPRALNEVRACY